MVRKILARLFDLDCHFKLQDDTDLFCSQFKNKIVLEKIQSIRNNYIITTLEKKNRYCSTPNLVGNLNSAAWNN